MPNFIENCVSPKANEGLHFIWYMVLKNGTMLTEYNNEGVHTPFDKAMECKYFFKEMGLMGNGGKVFIDPANGEIHMNKDEIANLYIEDKDGRYNISSNDNIAEQYKEFITRKYVSYDVDMSNRESNPPSQIHAVTLGYKVTVPVKDGNIECTIQYALPMGKNSYFVVNMLSSIDFDGEIVMHYGTGTNEDRGSLQLKAGVPEEMILNL